MKNVYVIHENEDWLLPLRAAFAQLQIPYEEWFVDQFVLDLSQPPPKGIFYNRMSASAHTRNHAFAPAMTASLLAWLEQHGRTVVNGRRALQLELRKSEQYIELERHNIVHPKTLICHDKSNLVETARRLGEEIFILKPNRGGKGTGVTLFRSIGELEHAIAHDSLGESIDGLWLIQQYIKPATGRIVRAEFVGGEFMYAVSINAEQGFELCPADSCQIDAAFCPATPGGDEKFMILDEYENPDLEKYASFLKSNHIQVGALEYVEDENGRRYVYDVNTNTNYNAKAESLSKLGRQGMLSIARYLGERLKDS